MEFGSIQSIDGRIGLAAIGHFDEREAAGLPGVTVRNKIYTFHSAVVSKSCVNVVLCGLKAEITDKDVGHELIPRFEIVFVELRELT